MIICDDGEGHDNEDNGDDEDGSDDDGCDEDNIDLNGTGNKTIFDEYITNCN